MGQNRKNINIQRSSLRWLTYFFVLPYGLKNLRGCTLISIMDPSLAHCDRCQSIPREIHNDLREIQTFGAQLIPCVPNETHESFLCRCSDCERFYEYTNYEHYYDGVPYYVLYLRRLSYIDCLGVCSPVHRELIQQRLANYEQTLLTNLHSTNEWLSREAAWQLARIALHQKNWAALVAYLLSHQPHVVEELVDTVYHFSRGEKMPDAVYLAFEPLSSHSNAQVRRQATELFIRYLLRNRSTQSSRTLFSTEQDSSKLTGALSALNDAHAVDLIGISPTLVRLLCHPEKQVSDLACTHLRTAFLRMGHCPPFIGEMLEILTQSNVTPAAAVLYALEGCRCGLPRAIDLIQPWLLNSQSVDAASLFLSAQLYQQANLSSLVPTFDTAMRLFPHCTALIKLLISWLEQTDSPVPVAVALSHAMNTAWGTVIAQHIQRRVSPDPQWQSLRGAISSADYLGNPEIARLLSTLNATP